MRHNRRAVMSERYKLYMRKNIFNGRYFVRNVQIALCAVVVIAMIVGAIVLSVTGDAKDPKTVTASVSVKDALFGNDNEGKQVAENTQAATEVATTQSKATEAATTEKATTDATTETASTQETTAQEEKSEFENKCIANVDETLNVRSTPSTDGEFVGSMNPGAIAIVEGQEGDWTKIKSGDVEGYVLSDYILTGTEAEKLAENYVTLRGTVLEDGVNIRSEQSTDADIVDVLDKDATITVLADPNTTEESTQQDTEAATEASAQAATEEATTQTSETEAETTEQTTATESATEATTETTETAETTEEATTQTAVQNGDIQWLSVMLEDGTTGYVSADLVDVDRLYEIAVSAEELQRREEEARKAAEEEAARKAAAEAAAAKASANTSSGSSSSGSSGSSSGSSTSYQGATTTPVTAASSGQSLGIFTITAYCGCAQCSGGSNRTASGTVPTEGRTIAADTSILPFGSQVVIGGVVYTVEDRGSGVNGKHIDIFFATHERAMAFGRKSMEVFKY